MCWGAVLDGWKCRWCREYDVVGMVIELWTWNGNVVLLLWFLLFIVIVVEGVIIMEIILEGAYVSRGFG